MTNRTAGLLWVLVAAPAICLLVPASRALAAEPQKLAFVVGISKYDKQGLRDLDYAEDDAAALAAQLETSGFKVQLMLGSSEGEKRATRDNLRRVLEQDFAGKQIQRLNKGDLVLISLSGHGLQFNVEKGGKTVEDAFFCPVDALKSDPATLLSVSDLMELISRNSGAQNNLFVIDACRDNPAKGGKGIDGSRINLPGNMAALYGSSSGTQSFESDKLKHGLLTYYLLEGLKGKAQDDEGEINWPTLVGYTQKQVSRNAPLLLGGTQQQQPNSISNLIGAPPILARLERSPIKSGGASLPLPLGEGENKLSGKEKPGSVITNSLGMKLAYIPAGEFTMGSPESEKGYDGKTHYENEKQHRVRITKPFYLGVYAVTQEEYETVMGDNPSWFAASGDGKDKVKGLDTKRSPVERVSWDDAQKFCTALGKKEGKTYRLPTEAEWEYAGRAGTTTAFAFGNSLSSEQANFDGNYPYGGAAQGSYLERTTSVGRHKSNAWGLYDMHGNVYQWCQDWYGKDYYSDSPLSDPFGPTAGSSRVLRGGSWDDYAVNCRSATRGSGDPAGRNFFIGFRVVAGR